jgi:hypothetical protein
MLAKKLKNKIIWINQNCIVFVGFFVTVGLKLAALQAAIKIKHKIMFLFISIFQENFYRF